MTLPTRVVFFSNVSENTLRFARRLNVPTQRIPLLAHEPMLKMENDFILLTPTYGGGRVKGSVPKQVVKFFNEHESNRTNCRGVVVGGNTTFGYGFASAGTLIADKLQIPLLHVFEVLGDDYDVEEVRKALFEFFPEQRATLTLPPNSFPIEGKFS